MTQLKRFLASAAIVTLLVGCGGDGTAPIPPVSGPAPTPSPPPTPSPSPTPTGTAFSDEFNATTLDRSIWTPVGTDFWVNNERQFYLDSPNTIQIRQGVFGADGGVLVLKPVWAPGQDPRTDRNADFASGRIESKGKFDFTYGKVEARIRMSQKTGIWPAFWLLGNGQWPATGEIDIMEYVGERDWISSALHGPGYSGNTPITKRFTFPAGTMVTDWNTYSVAWSSSTIVFSVNDTEYHRVNKSEVERYGAWAFDNRKYLILNFALGGDYPFGVNGVSAPYRGLPQSTVDAIRADEVEMLVDWVRVTPL